MDIYLAEPRGFCAGVRRAISLVEQALEKYGAPVYVRHEIVHNKHVIADLTAKGAVFVESLEEADVERPLVFSAHGVSRYVVEQARKQKFLTIDATCPLVEKVHRQIRLFQQRNMEIIVIGKKNHPEIIGTLGQIDCQQKVHVINSLEEAKCLSIPLDAEVGFVTQTTLSIDDTQEIVAYLQKRFTHLNGLAKADICYATTNRQVAVKALLKSTPYILILGSQNSSNSRHLKDLALQNGALGAWLVDDISEIDWKAIDNLESLGISAGASAPEYLVADLLEELRRRYRNINEKRIIIAQEKVQFKL